MTDKKWESLAEEENSILDETQQEDSTQHSEETTVIAGILEHPDYKKLEALLARAEAKADENLSVAMREKAERENATRRFNEDLRKTRDYSLTEFARSLLAVSDSLDQAVPLCADSPTMKEGIELTQKQLYTVFDQFAIKIFDPTGEKFDPLCHEAMSMVENPDVASGHVVMTFQKGYWINDRLLRPARVIVSK